MKPQRLHESLKRAVKRAGLVAVALAGAIALAQDLPGPVPGPEGQDVPGRAARLGFIAGSVSFQPGSVEDWVAATPNRPLTTGDRLWTDAGARAEVHLGSAAMRLSGRTNFSFINLDDRTAQIQLSMGTMSVRVRRLADDETIEVDTPQAALSLLRPGEYRIEVNEQGDTSIVTVRAGEIEATAGQAFTIRPRQQVRITTAGEAGAPSFDQREAPPADAFDLWCQDRDRREDMSQSGRYVSRDMPGYSDLDGAGRWDNVGDYGEVWMPTAVPVGWAPYRYGHWAWIAPWGWTWVDDAPWGYAPFHYGRWVFVRGGWGWVPGPVVVAARPVYAPALVAWVGGPSFGVAIGIGGGAAVGWFPLGPREVFVPAYHYSPAYIERVNVTNTVIVNRTVFESRTINVTNVTYVNRGVAGAVTAVPGGAFVGGRPIAAAAVAVRPEAMARVNVTAVAAVAPQREAVLGGRAVTRIAPPAAVMNRTVVTRVAPPPPPVAFERQQESLRANPGRPLDRAAYTQIRSSSPAPQPRVNYRPAIPSASPRIERQVNPPAVTNPNPPARTFERPAERPVNVNPPPVTNPNPPARTFERPAERPVNVNPPPVTNPNPPARPFERPAERPVNVNPPPVNPNPPARPLDRPAEHAVENTQPQPPVRHLEEKPNPRDPRKETKKNEKTEKKGN